MRLLNSLITAGVLIAPLPLIAQQAAPQKPDRQVVCHGQASGAQGEEVSVSIYVEPDGTRVGSYAAWSPPQLDHKFARALDLPDLRFEIVYSEPTPGAIGAPQSALVFVSVFSPLRKPESPAKLNARLDRLSPSIRFDGGAAAPLALQPMGADMMDLPGSATRTASLTLPSPLPRETAIILADKKGKVMVSQRYATGSTASRDALYVQAWKQADAATANLMACDLTTGEIPDGLIKPPQVY